MEFRQLGPSEATVSVLSLGSWLTYEFMEERAALAVLARGIEAGINFLDDARYDDRTGTAPLKSGYSEVVFGRLLRRGGWRRADLIIANKLWHEFYPAQNLEAELDGSLARLQLEYLDLVYCAPPPAALPMIEMIRQIDALIRSGKLRFWGVLNWPMAQLEAAYQVAATEGLAAPCAAQLPYSLLQPSPVEEEHTLQVCTTAGIGVVASYALHGGVLSGKYQQAGAGRFSSDDLEQMRQQGVLSKVERVIGIAQDVGCTAAQLALGYCLKNTLVSSLLFGATTVAQLEENIGTLAILPRLDQAVLAALRAIG